MVADVGRAGDGGNGDADSKSSLWRAVRRFFDSGEVDQSLRAHLEEVIDEHEDADAAQGTVQGDLQQSEREMLRNLLHFSEMDASDICIPRGEIIAMPNTATWAQVVAGFATHGHSRMPVYRETLDDVIGMVLMKDVFPLLASGQTPADWLTLLRQPLFVPCPRPALDVLADMRRGRVHLAVVLDEYSGTEGIVTFEDLVEEIVGDVEDEHDDAPVALLVPLEGGMWDADARALLEDVGEEVDPRLAEVEEDIDTLGGLAFLLAEQVPSVGTILDHDSGWRIEVTAGDERHVTRLRLHPPVTPAKPTDED